MVPKQELAATWPVKIGAWLALRRLPIAWNYPKQARKANSVEAAGHESGEDRLPLKRCVVSICDWSMYRSALLSRLAGSVRRRRRGP